ncbi:MAG: hypothetical protein IT311_00050 [Anaerolineales bacterium]|nr:hypothetical protein [Anaerolineales bacterium]MCZ2121285.1 hypothetical protein [Anaerolineales bacterium]
MNKRIRLFFAVVILSISIALLLWGYLPNPRETRLQVISPVEMQLPATP